jgi:cytochrome b561
MSRETSVRLFDDANGYGLVSRSLHWLMAALFALQFLSAIFHFIDRELPVTQLLWATHYSVGFTLLVLVVLRAVWGLINLGHRPPHGKGLLGLASLGAHLAIYALMIFIPSVAVLRAYGGGRGMTVYGVQIFQPGERNEVLVAPAHLLHGPAGWLLLVMVIGHIGMVFVHKYAWREDILGRMTRGRQDDARFVEAAGNKRPVTALERG